MLVGVLAIAATVTRATPTRATPTLATPTHISGFAVEPTVTRIHGTPYTTLAISSDPDVDGLLSVTHPDHPQQRVHEELEDAHGVLGVWPSARAAARQIVALEPPPKSVLELGAGAGLPSLVAAVHHGAEVLATDVEELPLDLLRAAWDLTAAAAAPSASLETEVLDIRQGLSELTSRSGRGFDTIVCADMLYDADVAYAVGAELGALVARTEPGTSPVRLIVCDPGRRCRADFLDAFREAAGALGEAVRFSEVDVVEEDEEDGEEGDGPRDIFDGSPQRSVGLLRW